MASYEERIYQIGLDALAEQERQVGEMRSRASVLLAAGAVIPSLLAHSIFRAHHPHGAVEIAATVVGVLGGVSLLAMALLLLLPYELGFSMNASRTYRQLWEQDLLEQPGVDLALADALTDRRAANETVTKRLAKFLRFALISLAVEAAGLAVAAALAS